MLETLRAAVKRYATTGLFQIALIGTIFSAIRLLQSPSTLTFFVFEVALGATAGIFLSGRAATSNQRSAPITRNSIDTLAGSYNQSSLARLRTMALTLNIRPVGNLEKLKGDLKTELAISPAVGSQVDLPEQWLGKTLVDRIAPPVHENASDRRYSGTNGYLKLLVDEGNKLLHLAKELGVQSTSYKRGLRKAREALRNGRVDPALSMVLQGNRRLRARLVLLIEQDLGELGWTLHRTHLVLSSVFFLFIAFALLALSTGLYIAPLAFYVLATGAAGAAALNVHINGDRRPIQVLVQIVILTVMLKFHFFFLNPYLYTSDTFFHFGGAQAIATTGHIPDNLGHYSFFPAFHVFGVAGVSVTGIPLTWYGIMAFVAQVTAIPVAFVLGREIASPRVGLFAAILTSLSVFFLLPTIPVPSLFGFVFLFLAIHALVQLRKSGGRAWLVLFWFAAIGALFSHPITALVLFLILSLRYAHFQVMRQSATARASSIPVLSYGVVYAGYLAFIAIVSFELFVRTLFSTTYEAPLATRPVEQLQSSVSYLLQSAMAPSGIAILFFFAAYGIFTRAGMSSNERRFLAVLTVAFVLIPGVEFIVQSFRGQSTRYLSYIVVPLVLAGGHGATRVFGQIRGRRRASVILVLVFMTFAFVGASSYLTANDVRYLYPSVPAIPTHITESALASRNFLALNDDPDRVAFMDLGSFLYFHNGARARNRLSLETATLDKLDGTAHGDYVVLNHDLLAYGSVDFGGFYDSGAIEASLSDSQAPLLYDAGTVRIYLVP